MSKPELRNITIIRANMSLGSKAQSDSLYGIVSRHGFEVFPDKVGLSLPVHARRVGENILYWLLTLVSNPPPLGRINFGELGAGYTSLAGYSSANTSPQTSGLLTPVTHERARRALPELRAMARPRRRTDRVKHCNPCTSFAAVHESVGIERTQHRDAAAAEFDPKRSSAPLTGCKMSTIPPDRSSPIRYPAFGPRS